MQNLVVPSLFFTNTMGLAHGLWDGRMIPCSSISCTRSSTLRRRANGVRLRACRIGGWTLVSMECVTTVVVPNSLWSRANKCSCSVRNAVSFPLSSSVRVSASTGDSFSRRCILLAVVEASWRGWLSAATQWASSGAPLLSSGTHRSGSISSEYEPLSVGVTTVAGVTCPSTRPFFSLIGS